MKLFKYKYFKNILTISILFVLADLMYFKTNSLIIKVLETLVIIGLFLPKPNSDGSNPLSDFKLGKKYLILLILVIILILLFLFIDPLRVAFLLAYLVWLLTKNPYAIGGSFIIGALIGYFNL